MGTCTKRCPPGSRLNVATCECGPVKTPMTRRREPGVRPKFPMKKGGTTKSKKK